MVRAQGQHFLSSNGLYHDGIQLIRRHPRVDALSIKSQGLDHILRTFSRLNVHHRSYPDFLQDFTTYLSVFYRERESFRSIS
jgi:hypothetical protein